MLALRIVSRTARRHVFPAALSCSHSGSSSTSRPCSQFWLRPSVSSMTYLSTSAKAAASSPSTSNIPMAKLSSEELGKLIYIAPKANADAMRRVKLLSFSTTIFSGILLPMANYKLYQDAMEQASTLAALILSNTIATIVVLSPFFLHYLVKRFALQIYYNSATDTFTTVHYNFFLQRRAHRFQSNEIIDADKDGKQSLFSLGTIVARGKLILFLPNSTLFFDQEAFEKLTSALHGNVETPQGGDDDDD